MDASLAPAIVRKYARCIQIMCEIDEAIDDEEPVDGLNDASNDEYELVKAKTKAGMLANHREYQWRKAELGRLLGVRPR
jgi:hypothetical protein